MRRLSLKSTDFGVDPTYSTTFGVDPIIAVENGRAAEDRTRDLLHPMQARSQTALRPEN